jgi:hypothetical protein
LELGCVEMMVVDECLNSVTGSGQR